MTVSKRSRREDFLLPVNIKAGNSLVKSVLCKVYLPAKVTDDLYLDFYPTSRQAQKLESIRKFVLKGRLRLGDDVATEIHAGEVYSHGVGTAYWGSKIREDTMSADPTELTVTHINGDGEYIPSNRCDGSFWLTPCSLLRSVASTERSYTGNVRIKAFRKLRITLVDGSKLTFTDHYKHKENDQGEDVTFSELVAEFSFTQRTRKLQRLHQTVSNLEDVLRLASFAARYRCNCVGWDFVTGNRYVRFYRRNVTIPKPRERVSDEEIIGLAEFPSFIRTSYRHYIKYKFKENLSRAIDYAIPRRGRTVESSYVSSFAALETLISGFRQMKQLETILPRSEWRPIQNAMKEYLTKQPPFDSNRGARKLVFEKLSELNRVSLARAVQSFCEFYEVNLKDLWVVG